MENQDIAANYRDENSQLVMIPRCMFSFREQIPLFLCVCVCVVEFTFRNQWMILRWL